MIQVKESLTRRDMMTPKHEVTVFNLLPPHAGSSGNLYGYGIGGLERMRNTLSMRKDSIELADDNVLDSILQLQNSKLAEYHNVNQI
jgi:hypothetical protein